MKLKNIDEIIKRYEIDASNFALDFGDMVIFCFNGKAFNWNKVNEKYYLSGSDCYKQNDNSIEITPEEKSKVQTIKMIMVLDK